MDKSLVQRVTDERFDLLMSVREYASEKLRGLGRELATTRAALAASRERRRDPVVAGPAERGALITLVNLAGLRSAG